MTCLHKCIITVMVRFLDSSNYQLNKIKKNIFSFNPNKENGLKFTSPISNTTTYNLFGFGV